jgi:transposase
MEVYHAGQIVLKVRCVEGDCERNDKMDVVFSKCSGLDVHEKTVVACIIVSERAGEVRKVKQTFATTLGGLRTLNDWLGEQGIRHVAMESTGVYWKPVYNVLHEQFDVWVVNARHFRQVPGRKTDLNDAEWLAELMRFGLLERSFIPEEWQRDLRDLTRYRTRLLDERSAAANRLHKLLEDGNIKLSSVVSDIQGVSARLMIEALIDNQLSPEQMAELAKRKLRQKIPLLVEALQGLLRPHHRFLLQEVLTHLDELTARITTLNQRIHDLVAPYATLIERLDAIPGVGRQTAEIVLAEIGPTVKAWPTANHLASWACLAPGNHESAGKRKSGKTQKGQFWLVRTLVEAAWAASHTTNTYLAAQFHRLRARRGAKRAAVAVAHSILIILFHLIGKPDSVFHELGEDYFLTKNKEQEQRRALKILNGLGFEVSLAPAATSG